MMDFFLYELAAAYLNAEFKHFTNMACGPCVIFKLPCGMCEVYTDEEVMRMAEKQVLFEDILYPKG